MQSLSWLVAAMMTWAPAKETELSRYGEIANDLITVGFDENESPLFEGEGAREQTVLLLASIAAHESGFRKDIEKGHVRGDSGTSWCMMQIHIGRGKTAEGWSGKELAEDRQRCFRAGLHLARESFRRCRAVSLPNRLSGYASGFCGNSPVSREMVSRAVNYWEESGETDDDFAANP